MNNNSLMPFGPFEGKPMLQVPAQHLLHLLEHGKLYGELKKFVLDNIAALRMAAAAGK